MILGGALITQYKTKEEAEPARFKNFQNRFHRKLTGSVEYRGVVPEEDDSVSLYGERSRTIFMVRDPALREPLSTVEPSRTDLWLIFPCIFCAFPQPATSFTLSLSKDRNPRQIKKSAPRRLASGSTSQPATKNPHKKTPRQILSPQGYKNLSPPTPLLRLKTLVGFFYNLV